MVRIGSYSRGNPNMSNYTEDVDTNSTSVSHDKFAIPRECFATLYVLGTVGSILALVHLFQKQKFKNTKQIFMLK